MEEQRRQLDLMEMDNARMNENVTLEIGRVKVRKYLRVHDYLDTFYYLSSRISSKRNSQNLRRCRRF